MSQANEKSNESDEFWTEINDQVHKHNKKQEELEQQRKRERKLFNDPSTFFQRSDPKLQQLICEEAFKAAFRAASRKTADDPHPEIKFDVMFTNMGPQIYNKTSLTEHLTPKLKGCLPIDATITTTYYSYDSSNAYLTVKFKNNSIN
jgi:hypothetical protein